MSLEKDDKDQKKENENENKGIFWNTFWLICIFISIILIICSCFYINKFNKNIRKHNLDYPWPKLMDLLPSIIILPIIICYKLLLEYSLKGFVDSCLTIKYKQEGKEQIRNSYRNKLARHLYKITFYTAITIFGYYVLKDLPYFPKEMGGKGYMSQMFEAGFPDSYFHKKPPLFDFYYNINLAYFYCDFIFLLISERQNDFTNMFLHHICTISLIIFSFITNYSNIGCLVIFCHMESDILGHVIRFVVHTDLHIFYHALSGVSFVSNFIYMRQFVLGEIIYTIYKYITWEWGIITTMLWLFLVILYIMHARWSFILCFKTCEIIFKKKRVTDDVTYKHQNDKNKKIE